MFSTVPAPIYIPIISVKGFPFLHTTPALFVDFLMIATLIGVR